MYVVIQSLSVGLLYVEEETVHSVHRFTMFWSLKRHWLHKIGNQAWGHSLTVSTKRRSVAAATKWPVWAEQAGQGHAGRRKWSVTRTDQNSIVGQILCSLRAGRSIVMQTHYQPSCFVTPDSVLLPSSPPLSPSAPFFAGAFSICDSELQASCLALFLSRLVDWKLQPRRPDDYVSGSPPTTLCVPH